MNIIPTSRLSLRVAGCAASVFLASSPVFAGELVLHKVPAFAVDQASAYPVNLARYHAGAQLETVVSHPISQLQLSTEGEDKNAAEAALLCDDPTVGYALPAGTTTLLVTFPKVENIGSLALLNRGARGQVTIAAANAKLSANSPQWQTLTEQELSGDGLHASVGPAEAKYVRLTFNLQEPGRISGLGLYATPRVSDFTSPTAPVTPSQEKSDSFTLIAHNLTDLHAKARALYVSSGADLRAAQNMIDDQVNTSYSFAAEDGSPVTVIDLGTSATLRRLSAMYAPRAGSIQFYVAQSLPGSAQSTPEDLKLDDASFADLKSVGTVNDDGTHGRAAVDFPATVARYVIVRWTPQAQDGIAFAISEVAAFGKPVDSKLMAANSGLSLGQVNAVEHDGKTMIDSKTMIDDKTVIEPKDRGESAAPQSPAEGPPPSLPQPPPFTFVPVLVPTSP